MDEKELPSYGKNNNKKNKMCDPWFFLQEKYETRIGFGYINHMWMMIRFAPFKP